MIILRSRFTDLVTSRALARLGQERLQLVSANRKALRPVDCDELILHRPRAIDCEADGCVTRRHFTREDGRSPATGRYSIFHPLMRHLGMAGARGTGLLGPLGFALTGNGVGRSSWVRELRPIARRVRHASSEGHPPGFLNSHWRPIVSDAPLPTSDSPHGPCCIRCDCLRRRRALGTQVGG
jgi:hypothetical protein